MLNVDLALYAPQSSCQMQLDAAYQFEAWPLLAQQHLVM